MCAARFLLLRRMLTGGRQLSGIYYGRSPGRLPAPFDKAPISWQPSGRQIAPLSAVPGVPFDDYVAPLLQHQEDVLSVDGEAMFFFSLHLHQYRWAHIARGCPNHPKYDAMPQRYRDLETEVVRAIPFRAELIQEARREIAKLFGEGVEHPPAALSLRRNTGNDHACVGHWCVHQLSLAFTLLHCASSPLAFRADFVLDAFLFGHVLVVLRA